MRFINLLQENNGDAPMDRHCFALIPIPRLDCHSLPGLVEERMEQ